MTNNTRESIIYMVGKVNHYYDLEKETNNGDGDLNFHTEVKRFDALLNLYEMIKKLFDLNADDYEELHDLVFNLKRNE